MKECTLQEAVELCEKNGGEIKSVNGEWRILSKHLDDVSYSKRMIQALWIYEPPQKSAFQEWNSSKPSDVDGILESKRLRKEGFNFALDLISGKIIKYKLGAFVEDFLLELKLLKEP